MSADKYAFLKMDPPPGYVAGLGRGASGFTTRSDIGPAREQVNETGNGDDENENGDGNNDEDDERFQDPENESGLLADSTATYDNYDKEADDIYASVDEHMASRRAAKREERERKEREEYERRNPKIQAMFIDLKRNLSAVSDEEWNSLPEGGNISGKRRKNNKFFEGRSYALPDSVLMAGREQNAMNTSLDERQMSDGAITNFAEIGRAQSNLLERTLDQVKGSSSSVSGTSSVVGGTFTSVDREGFLTELDTSGRNKSAFDIGDIKRVRTILQSLLKSNPKNADGYIAASLFEEQAGKSVAAKRIIQEGCENCPLNEAVWLHAAKINSNEDAKAILANAVQKLPQSVNIWLEASNLENDDKNKTRVIRLALEHIPNSVKLWQRLVNLEDDPENARLLLERATEIVPLSVELWLALARLETPTRAKQVLNDARKAIPTSHEIWIAAGRLQEQQGEDVDALIAAGVKQLRRRGVRLSREDWIKEAEKAEENESVLTAGAIIKATIALDIDEENRVDTWMNDAERCISNKKYETARAIFAYALKAIPHNHLLWRKAAELEKQYGSQEQMFAILGKATQQCPTAEYLWLFAAKESWVAGDVSTAQDILKAAFAANPDSEQIWLAACKLEAQNNNISAARQLFNRAKDVAGTSRIWMKYAVFERIYGTSEDASKLVTEAIEKFPTLDKLYMIKGQILEDQGDIGGAREAYSTGTKKVTSSWPLWLLLARLEEKKAKLVIKARAVLERARHYVPDNEEIWLESILLEERQNNMAQAKALMSRAIQACETSGLLWSKSVWMEEAPKRKTRMVDALKKTDNNPHVLVTIARIFWLKRNLKKAREFFERAIKGNPDLGDSWAWWLKFELQHGTPELVKALTDKAVAAEPHHGQVWQSVAKDVKNNELNIEQILNLVKDLIV